MKSKSVARVLFPIQKYRFKDHEKEVLLAKDGRAERSAENSLGSCRHP